MFFPIYLPYWKKQREGAHALSQILQNYACLDFADKRIIVFPYLSALMFLQFKCLHMHSFLHPMFFSLYGIRLPIFFPSFCAFNIGIANKFSASIRNNATWFSFINIVLLHVIMLLETWLLILYNVRYPPKQLLSFTDYSLQVLHY